ncbi:hypothetical protein EOM39_01335 [Candidatus Gracilibacteria bacterium]|nr:hypothetical protein [Candidatus Gracilibacteria bacterium]
MNTKKRLKSGAELEITMASFRDTKDLVDSIARELKKNDIDIKTLNLESEIDGGIINSLKNMFLGILVNEEIMRALNKCFEKALYNNKKITEDLFDNDERARADYFVICWEVARYNLAPFLNGIDLSLIKGVFPKLTTQSIQKSK